MPIIEPFEEQSYQYDAWFDHHAFTYQSELLALKRVVPQNSKGIEIGMGSGRFAAPLGIITGIDPSKKLSQFAVKRELCVINSVAEALPIADETF